MTTDVAALTDMIAALLSAYGEDVDVLHASADDDVLTLTLGVDDEDDETFKVVRLRICPEP